MRDPILFPVHNDPSRPGEVRRAAVGLAAALDFPDEVQGRVALVATEAATNLVKHATGGEIVVRSLAPSEGVGLEILAFDRGRAWPTSAAACGTASRRPARRGRASARSAAWPTCSTSRRCRPSERSWSPASGRPRSPARPPSQSRSARLCLPVAGEEVCGDAWSVVTSPTCTAVLVADGLGHGPSAATAAREAVRVFAAAVRLDPVEILQTVHAALRSTRGAAAAVAVIDRAAGILRYAGVGNIAAAAVGPRGRQGLVSLAGTLGHEARKFQAFESPWPAAGCWSCTRTGWRRSGTSAATPASPPATPP